MEEQHRRIEKLKSGLWIVLIILNYNQGGLVTAPFLNLTILLVSFGIFTL